MNKQVILGIAIATAFVIGVLSANPVVDAAGGWKEALGIHEGDNSAHHEIPEAQVYEVSQTTKISAGELSNETLVLNCLAGDKVDSGEVNFVTVPPIFMAGTVVLQDTDAVFTHDPASITSQGNPNLAKRIGYSVTPTLAGSGTPLGIPVDVTATIHCLSPS